MNKLITTTGGIIRRVLGKPACPFLRKNPVSHSAMSKRLYSGSGGFGICMGRGFCKRTNSGLFVEKVGARNFSVNFIGRGL